ncbi:hypothetical protein SAMN06265222_106137 [Neorhodopirellula lusitana]|uniref:Leucine Rich repeats (2 copies) n=1 Tax=Neorhodopirellula lusitana TaxID=445327 RepID=A0ABY1Q444_9BACT|nr:hypothetical protein [Neorhodopirellula lusitana]SMP58861.1 hypothetical protein SAMN06265222_106137 [Neorhodopirellula lusitana]
MDTAAEYRRAIVCSLLFASITGLILVLANVPTKRVQVGEHIFGNVEYWRSRHFTIAESKLVKAGWPLTYQIQVHPQIATESTPLYVFSWWKLLLDILVVVAVVGGVGGYTYYRQLHISRSADGMRARRRFDITTALVCFLLPFVYYGGASWVASRHKALADQIGEEGTCTLAAELPEWFADRCPRVFHSTFFRLTHVQIHTPSPQIFDQLTRINTLRDLQVVRNQVDGQQLRLLKHSPALTTLRLERCKLAPEAIEAVANHSLLLNLSLRGSALSASELVQLDRLTNLLNVDLTGTGIRLAGLNMPHWQESVQSLDLMCPEPGQADQLSLKDWDSLEKLLVTGDGIRVNREVLLLEICDCPNLKEVMLDRLQKYSLVAKNLPELERINDPYESYLFDEGSAHYPSLVRWQHVDMEDVPSLQLLEFLAPDIETVAISGASRLKAVTLVYDEFRESTTGDSSSPSEASIESWVDAVSQLDSIQQLTIEGVKLTVEQFQRVCRLPFLNTIHYDNSHLGDVAIQETEFSDSIQYLDFGRASLSQKTLERLLELPNLKTIRADFSGVTELRIHACEKLVTIDTLPFESLETVELLDLPRMTSGVVVKEGLQRIRVVGAPRLQEIVVGSAWPKDYEFGQLTGVTRFAAGGPEVTDDLFESLLTCRKLDELSFAYPSLSRSVLERMSELRHLTKLELPGCELNDSIISNWQGLSRLRRVCFDDTEVGGDTIAWLATLESLRSLSLNYLKLDVDARQTISMLRQVPSMSFVETQLDPEPLIHLLSGPSLEDLDLSGTEVSNELLDAIAANRTLRSCVLTDCQLDREYLSRLFNDDTRLVVESTESDTQLVLSYSTRYERSRSGFESRPPHGMHRRGRHRFREQRDEPYHEPPMNPSPEIGVSRLNELIATETFKIEDFRKASGR